MLHPELGEILPLADNQQVVWEIHQELPGREGGAPLNKGYCDQSIMDNHRLFSPVCGRQPVFSGYIDPDCRRGDHPSHLDENLQTAGLIKWLGFNQAQYKVGRHEDRSPAGGVRVPGLLRPEKEKASIAKRCPVGAADGPALPQSYFISRIRTSIPSSPCNSSTILAVSVLP